jgi:16S rRNA (cytosine1402-N4)-methyltransferase
MTENPQGFHKPVLLLETLEFLQPQPGDTFLDATLGGGGHSFALAQALRPNGTLIGLDRDTEALAFAERRLAPLRPNVNIILLHSAFGKMSEAIATLVARKNLDASPLNGAIFDLGVSSHQLDTARGFSFRRDEGLDMRMDSSQGMTAQKWLADASEAEIARALWEYGEEKWAKRIAQRIVATRIQTPLQTTGQLSALVEAAVPRGAWPPDTHVATRTYQGIRIAINGELEQLEEGLAACISLLRPQGRLAVISYHSLEDRIVKRVFQREAGRTPSPPGSSPAVFLRQAESVPRLRLLTRKPIAPTAEETARNPRARSAKLRVVERISFS